MRYIVPFASRNSHGAHAGAALTEVQEQHSVECDAKSVTPTAHVLRQAATLRTLLHAVCAGSTCAALAAYEFHTDLAGSAAACALSVALSDGDGAPLHPRRSRHAYARGAGDGVPLRPMHAYERGAGDSLPLRSRHADARRAGFVVEDGRISLVRHTAGRVHSVGGVSARTGAHGTASGVAASRLLLEMNRAIPVWSGAVGKLTDQLAGRLLGGSTRMDEGDRRSGVDADLVAAQGAGVYRRLFVTTNSSNWWANWWANWRAKETIRYAIFVGKLHPKQIFIFWDVYPEKQVP